jgi:PAT family acetyl-CoA transporter-like MFS transporter 1
MPSQRKEVLSEDETNVTSVFKTIWSISQLKSRVFSSTVGLRQALIVVAGIRSFLVVYMTCKIGSAAHDAATALKMVEKGLGKEDFAAAVLFDFPIQVIGGYLIARWSRGNRPLRPWIWAIWPRLLFALLAAVLLWKFPKPPITPAFFAFIVIFRSFGEMPTQVCFFAERPVPSPLIMSSVQRNSSASVRSRLEYLTQQSAGHTSPYVLHYFLPYLLC